MENPFGQLKEKENPEEKREVGSVYCLLTFDLNVVEKV